MILNQLRGYFIFHSDINELIVISKFLEIVRKNHNFLLIIIMITWEMFKISILIENQLSHYKTYLLLVDSGNY